MPKLIKCLECGNRFKRITGGHIERVHKLSKEEYLLKHPGAQTASEEYLKSVKKRMRSQYNVANSSLRKKVGQRTFDFVKNKNLKRILQRDYSYAKKSLDNKLWKPTIILYGGIIEAVLKEKTKSANKTFAEVLELARERGIISDRDYHKIHLIKDLRNYVHLHKELQEDSDINEYYAYTFSDICNKIIKEFK